MTPGSTGHSQHVKAAIQQILENESLTADLDDEAAEVLLNWGMANVRRIYRTFLDVPEYQLEELTYPLLRANNKMMRRVNNLAEGLSEKPLEDSQAALLRVLVSWGDTFPEEQPAPDQAALAAFLEAHSSKPIPDFIDSLREYCESSLETGG